MFFLFIVFSGMPSTHNMSRTVNKRRKAQRPQDPTTLQFDINMDMIGQDFLKGDIRVENNRHILLATDQQLQLLRTTQHWFVDGTFKLIKAPFTQIWSIHGFIKHGTTTKQVPLLFVLMSSRRKVSKQTIT